LTYLLLYSLRCLQSLPRRYNSLYTISELASKVGLSRTTLLYYEKIRLISGDRQPNGYRVYTEKDLQRILLIQKLQSGGLTLKECKACLEEKVDKALLLERLTALDKEIEQKQQSKKLLVALIGEGDTKAWHEDLNKRAPDAHLEWLLTQGFSDKEALQLKWLSKNMNEHDLYMNDFMKIFETLERWGPGSEEDTKKALLAVPKLPESILEIGCGKGLSTEVLAKCSNAEITALDNEQSALDRLEQRFAQQCLVDQLNTVCASMTKLPFPKNSFDLLWAEGSAYVIGIENALAQWRSVIKKHGYLMLSDMVWRTSTPSCESIEFWEQEYPDIQLVQTRINQMKKAGYQVIDHFPQSESAWLNYYTPLGKRLSELEEDLADSSAFKDVQNEVKICTQFGHEFGYHMFILEKFNS